MWDPDNNRLIIFGGRTAERKRLNDVWFLDLDSWMWHRPNTDGAPPSPREHAVACFWAGSMVVFGERGGARSGAQGGIWIWTRDVAQAQYASTPHFPRPSPLQYLCSHAIGGRSDNLQL